MINSTDIKPALQKLISRILCCVLLALSSPALAVTSPFDYISSLYLSAAANYAFRISFVNASTLSSSCTGSFAYVNVSSDNYQAYVAALMTAYTAHKPVSIGYNITNGFCNIVEFGVSG